MFIYFYNFYTNENSFIIFFYKKHKLCNISERIFVIFKELPFLTIFFQSKSLKSELFLKINFGLWYNFFNYYNNIKNYFTPDIVSQLWYCCYLFYVAKRQTVDGAVWAAMWRGWGLCRSPYRSPSWLGWQPRALRWREAWARIY